MSIDYTLVQEYKKNKDQNTAYILYTKYSGLQNKVYFSHFKNFKHISFKDFKQECFVLMLDLLNYIDLDKIKDKEHWNIYSLYKTRMLNYKLSLYKYVRRDAIYYADYEKDINDNVIPYFDHSKDLEITINKYIDKLSILDKNLFYYRFLYNDWQGMKLKDVAKKCNVTQRVSHYHLQKILSNLSSYLEIKEEPSRRI